MNFTVAEMVLCTEILTAGADPGPPLPTASKAHISAGANLTLLLARNEVLSPTAVPDSRLMV